eukprot:GHVU01011401.1.p2 GENE.GHVU01011401.1~~GHVU01011401.1.p2  ORF type:complete len:142 (+),score=12.45 GHVU01011401.1:1526-1951(+)
MRVGESNTEASSGGGGVGMADRQFARHEIGGTGRQSEAPVGSGLFEPAGVAASPPTTTTTISSNVGTSNASGSGGTIHTGEGVSCVAHRCTHPSRRFCRSLALGLIPSVTGFVVLLITFTPSLLFVPSFPPHSDSPSRAFS